MPGKNNVKKTGINQEQQWIAAAQKDPSEFKQLFCKYYNRIFNYALRRTGDVSMADDIAANTFFNALAKIKKFQWRGVSFSAWLFRIATNEINQLYRKSKHLIPLNPEIEAHLIYDRSSDSALLEVEEAVARNEKFKQVHAAIVTLKLKYQTALILRYMEEKSIKEIAEILDISENTVKTHIRRGLIQLKERL